MADVTKGLLAKYFRFMEDGGVGGGGERGRDRQTDRQTETDRHTERDTKTETEKDYYSWLMSSLQTFRVYN